MKRWIMFIVACVSMSLILLDQVTIFAASEEMNVFNRSSLSQYEFKFGKAYNDAGWQVYSREIWTARITAGTAAGKLVGAVDDNNNYAVIVYDNSVAGIISGSSNKPIGYYKLGKIYEVPVHELYLLTDNSLRDLYYINNENKRVTIKIAKDNINLPELQQTLSHDIQNSAGSAEYIAFVLYMCADRDKDDSVNLWDSKISEEQEFYNFLGGSTNLYNITLKLDRDSGSLKESVIVLGEDSIVFKQNVLNNSAAISSLGKPELLKDVLGNGYDRVVRNLKLLHDFEEEYKKQAQEEQEEQAVQQSKLDVTTVAAAYTQAAINLHSNRKNTAAVDTAKKILRSFPEVPDSQLVDVADKTALTAEEILRLQVFYDLIFNYDSNTDGAVDFQKLIQENAKLEWTVDGSDVIGNANGKDLQTVKVEAEEVVKMLSERPEASQAIQMMMENAEYIAKYYLAKSYGCASNIIGNDTSSITYLANCEFLESIVYKREPSNNTFRLDFSYTGTPAGGGSSVTIHSSMPEMTNIRLVGGSEQSKEAYYTLQHMLLLMGSYVSGNNKTPITKKKEFESLYYDMQPEDIDFTEVKGYLRYLRAGYGIVDAMNCLGVSPWNDSMKEFFSLMNRLDKFRDISEVLGLTYEINESEAMNVFFNIDNNRLSNDYLKGVALSATFRPLKTNMYDIESVAFMEDTDWISRFHYPYGFYRKALYIDTDPDAAVKRYVTSGRKGTTRIATLRDMFEPEKDIVLYLDERFYNADALKEAITAVGSDLSIASVAGDITYTSEQDSTASDDVVSSVIDNLSNLTKSEYKDVNSVVKTNGKTSYNARVRSAVAAYDAESKDKKETLVMTADEIDYWLAPDTSEDMQTFSVLQPLAVVSAIYRDPALWNIISGQLGNSMPVFVSSQNLFQYVGVDHQNFGCVYNYAMLKNLSAVVDIDVDIQADMDKPLYMDIYGNILTDSGLVVMPAMSNASLFDLKKTNYDVTTMGFCYLYSQGVYELPATFTNSDKLEGILDYDEISGTWQLGAKMIDNVILYVISYTG